MLVWNTLYILVFFFPVSTISGTIPRSKNYCQNDDMCFRKENYSKIYQQIHIERIALELPGVNKEMLRNGMSDSMCRPPENFTPTESSTTIINKKKNKYDLISFKSVKKEIHKDSDNKELILYSFRTSDEEQYLTEKSILNFFLKNDAFVHNNALKVIAQRYVHNLPENKMISDRILYSNVIYYKNSTNVSDAQEIDILKIVKSVKNSTVYVHLSAVTVNDESTTTSLDNEKEVVVKTFQNKISEKRKKRSSNKCNGDCCFYEISLGIKEMGWDWIISPRGLHAGYCAGSCKKGEKFGKDSATMNKDYVPCCAPVKFQPVEILYYNFNGKIVQKTIDALQILECGCI